MPPAPFLMIATGVLFLLAAVKVLVQQRRIVEVVPRSNITINVPTKWNDGEIARLLQGYQDQPAVLSYAVSSIRSRLIMGQDLKTAQRRLKLIASVIELFKLNQEMQGILHDIHMAEKEFEISQVEAAIRLEDAQSRQRSEALLRQLRSQRDELVLKKEITQLGADTDSIHRATKPQAQPSPEQQRQKRHADSEARIQKLKALKQEALKLDDADERLQKVNAIDDEIQAEMDEWRKTL
jgi:hypothetical protein